MKVPRRAVNTLAKKKPATAKSLKRSSEHSRVLISAKKKPGQIEALKQGCPAS